MTPIPYRHDYPHERDQRLAILTRFPQPCRRAGLPLRGSFRFSPYHESQACHGDRRKPEYKTIFVMHLTVL